MRLIDADALKKDDELTEWLTRDTIRTGKMLKAFSELFVKKINDAPTVNAVSEEVYTREYNLRKDAEFKVYKLEKALEQKPFDIETYCKEHFCVMVDKDVWEKAEKALKQEPNTGHWKLVQRGKSIDICCSNCEKVRIKQYAYNYTIDQLDKEDLEECFECADMRYCPNCGVKMESEG